MKVKKRKSSSHFDFNSLTVKKITVNFSKRIIARSIRKRDKPNLSMKLKAQMITERFRNQFIRKDRDIDTDYIQNRIKTFNTYYFSDTWIRTETRILDKLNQEAFSYRHKKEIPYSKFKRIQEKINHYKIRNRNTNDFETGFKNFRDRFNKYTLQPKSDLEYRLADLTADWNLRIRNHFDIPYILSKKCSFSKY
jgi:hypothetical protein